MRFLTDTDIEQMGNPDSFVPVHTRGGLRRWIEHGIAGGSFLDAVLRNDLKTAFAMADEENTRHLRGIVAWLWNYAPANCWGSVENVNEWRAYVQEIEE